MPESVVWEEPPERGRSAAPVDWREHLRPLLAHPDQWARVARFAGETSAYKVAQRLRSRTDLGGDFEFTGRRSDDGGSSLYARCIAQPDEPLTPMELRRVLQGLCAIARAGSTRQVRRAVRVLVEDLGARVDDTGTSYLVLDLGAEVSLTVSGEPKALRRVASVAEAVSCMASRALATPAPARKAKPGSGTSSPAD